MTFISARPTKWFGQVVPFAPRPAVALKGVAAIGVSAGDRPMDRLPTAIRTNAQTRILRLLAAARVGPLGSPSAALRQTRLISGEAAGLPLGDRPRQQTLTAQCRLRVNVCFVACAQ